MARLALVFVLTWIAGTEGNKVWLISFDGFRWDYMDQFETPNLDMMKVQGVHAPKGITTTFVTKTFPAHYTYATGLHSESHGIVNNNMYDPTLNASFQMGNVESRWWNRAEPVWTTATLQGLKVGTHFWPGADVELNGTRTHRWKSFDQTIPFKDRVDQVVRWMQEDQVSLSVSYFEEPDSSGHNYGAMSQQVGHAVRKMDSFIGYITARLKAENLYDQTDVILVSDHGMTNVTADHAIFLSDFLALDKDILAMPDEGGLVNILPYPGREEYVLERLRGVHPKMNVYLKQEIPERFHYRNSPRILPIVLMAEEGYYITKTRPFNKSLGQHGYDNALPSMRPFFFARGPHFKAGYKVNSSYQSVNVYSLICHLLGIQPAPNNGSLDASWDMLHNGQTERRVSLALITTSVFIVCIVF